MILKVLTFSVVLTSLPAFAQNPPAPPTLPKNVECVRTYPPKSDNNSLAPKRLLVTNISAKKATLDGNDGYLRVYAPGGKEFQDFSKADDTAKVNINEFHESHDFSEIEFYWGEFKDLGKKDNHGNPTTAIATYMIGTEYGDLSIDAVASYLCR
jgi:hypothetical protein